MVNNMYDFKIETDRDSLDDNQQTKCKSNHGRRMTKDIFEKLDWINHNIGNNMGNVTDCAGCD